MSDKVKWRDALELRQENARLRRLVLDGVRLRLICVGVVEGLEEWPEGVEWANRLSEMFPEIKDPGGERTGDEKGDE
jgi:hypothetical protein